MSNRHYRVFVVETRTIEVDVHGAADELDAQRTARRIADGEKVAGARVFRRHPARNTPSTACWMNRPVTGG